MKLPDNQSCHGVLSVYCLNYILQIFIFTFIELEASKKQTEADKKVIDDLVRERDILNKVIENSNLYVYIISFN